MVRFLQDSPLLLLFLVAAIGTVVGHVKVFGFGLGIAAVLFVGLGAGAIDPALKLPEIVYVFGLVLFVYTVGLSSGPGFFASFRRRGLRDNGMAVGVLVLGAALSCIAAMLLHLRAPFAAGIFAGSLTNTPALASVLEALKSGNGAALNENALVEPVVAYSLTYPFGVVGVILGIYASRKLWKQSPTVAVEPGVHSNARSLDNCTIRITRNGLTRDLAIEQARTAGHAVVFGRMKRGDQVTLVLSDVSFEPGDLVSLVGTTEDVRATASLLGEPCEDRLDLDRHVLDFRRMFVSQPAVTEKPLAELRLPQRFGALITRIRRGDVELLPDAQTELELGDRVRVVAPRDRMSQVATVFGDSYRSLSEIDVLTFGVGIAMGLLLGSVPIPLPGGATFKLGFAGGPLIVGLILGRLGRTGSLVWTMPYSANLTVRQLGLVLFLAGVGTRSGYAFASTLSGGTSMLLSGIFVTTAVTMSTLWIAHRLFKIPLEIVSGIVSGVHTQPAALAFANEQSGNDLPNIGYATVFPVATITKILLAQMILLVLR